MDTSDTDLPTGSIVLPQDEPVETTISQEQIPGTPPDDTVPIDVRAPEVINPDAVAKAKPPTAMDKLFKLKDSSIAWGKEHKFLAGIMGLLLLGTFLSLWPLITYALIVQHMMRNTQGNANKDLMFKIVIILGLIGLSVQAIWLVQLSQAASFSSH